jgi:membrane protein implicated in regulation of membrane protease activity
MSTLTKYLILQVPGWLLAVIVVTALRHWLELPLWAALGLIALWVVKDLVMYPLLRTAYESNVKTGVEQLVGTYGVAQDELAPRGYVRVRGELWQAEVRSGSQPVSAGSTVRVEGARGMTLFVRPEERNQRAK